MASVRALWVSLVCLYWVKLFSTPRKASLACPDFDKVEALLMILRQMSESNIYLFMKSLYIEIEIWRRLEIIRRGIYSAGERALIAFVLIFLLVYKTMIKLIFKVSKYFFNKFFQSCSKHLKIEYIELINPFCLYS